MHLDFFARFQARPDMQDAVGAALAEVVSASRAEPGCLFIEAFGATGEPGLFLLHSRWIDEAAFDRHAGLAHTRSFLEAVTPLLQAPAGMDRARSLG